MWKSSLIVGGVMLVLGGITAFIFPLCVPCLALFAGLGAGFLAGVFDHPGESGAAARLGASAGAAGGLGALGGHLVGGLASAAFIGPEAAADLLRSFGFALETAPAADPAGYYFGAFATSCCFGLFELMLMAGLGALGGLLWRQFQGTQQPGLPA